jgi:hypothetical protein
MAFDVEGARKAGYSDREIADHLARQHGYDAPKARSSGYADSEIVAHLAGLGRIPGPAVSAPSDAAGPSILDKVIGAGEAALATVTGMTGGALGFAGGLMGGIAGEIASGKIGQPGANAPTRELAVEGANALTYQPRTQSGQEQTAAIGEVMQNLIPIMGAAPGLPMPRGAIPTAVQAAKVPAAAVIDRAATAVPQALREAPGRAMAAVRPGQAAPTPGTMGSAGAAGTDMATQRMAAAESLPVPIRLTKGQASRDPAQLTFERETAKQADMGAPLRNNSAMQNQALHRNFEAMIDQTGAVAPSIIETGRAVVDAALVPAAARAKNAYRVKYKAAENAGQLEDPVSLAPLADYLNANRAGRTSAPILSTIADELRVQGVGEGALADGTLTAGNATLAQAEAIRKAVNKFVKDTDPNDVRVGVEIKKVIDQTTEGLGGDLYKEARKARQRYSQLFEDNAIVADLLKNRRGTADRQVALEDVFRRSVLNGSRESLGMMRRTLQVAGGEEGAQAWRELQGASLKWIKDEATKSAAPDSMGNVPFSADGFNRAIRTLDTNGKLEFMFGRQGAQQLRDLNAIAADVLTLPREAWVNSSNTAAVLAATFDAALMGGGVPAPVMSMARLGVKQIKDVRLRRRIEDALNNPKKQAPSRTDNPAR